MYTFYVYNANFDILSFEISGLRDARSWRPFKTTETYFQIQFFYVFCACIIDQTKVLSKVINLRDHYIQLLNDTNLERLRPFLNVKTFILSSEKAMNGSQLTIFKNLLKSF
jgi:hypothetical protein